MIRESDFVESIAAALQHMSYYHSPDFIRAMGKAHAMEQSPAARDAIAQIITNSRLCAEHHRPICQDTGIVVVFLKIGMDVRWDARNSVLDMVNEGVRRAYLDPQNLLRASIVMDPAGSRKNTRDNTPAVVHMELVPGDGVEVKIAAKGGGSENKAKLAMLNPGEDIVQWVLDAVDGMGAGWCPPGMLGIGIGGTAEKAALLAKEALLEPVDMSELKARGAKSGLEAMRIELFDRINGLGIGAQGLGGLSTVLDVKILDYPTHAASLPVAVIPNCAATRHAHFFLDGSGPVYLPVPKVSDWPDIEWRADFSAKRVNLDTVTKEEIQSWKPGEKLLFSGKMLTGRDAAHRRISRMIAQGEKPPVDFAGRFIYYVGPVDPVAGEVVGPAGPTTATRMDAYTDTMLELGLMGMIGKAERGADAIASIKKHGAAYLVAVGGAAYLVSRAIRQARVVAFEDLGMEAIYEFEVEDMPVTVAVDSSGNSIHREGPAKWRKFGII
ncbi:MAG: fumarate hydratase [Burkholderiales bacterium]